jgi:AAA domain/Primase C terminal 2 (PriCT-2)
MDDTLDVAIARWLKANPDEAVAWAAKRSKPPLSDSPTMPPAFVEHCLRHTTPRDPSPGMGNRDPAQVEALVRWLAERETFDSYEDWLGIGMALKVELGDAGFPIWQLATWDDREAQAAADSKWDSFASVAGANHQTLGTWLKRAHEMGWRGKVRPTIEAMFPAESTADMPGMPSPSIVPPETPLKSLLKTSAALIRELVPPDYLVDGVLQRRYCYSVTARTGHGKTAVAMRVTAHVAIGRPMGGLEVARGTVVYLAGENPTDVTMRWLGVTQDMGIDPEIADVHFITERCPLGQIANRIRQEVEQKGLEPVLVVVDTSAAYAGVDDENDNAQIIAHAQLIRTLTELPGGPCVLALCHPTKRAANDDLIPRGGGGYLAEVDGNIALIKGETLVTAAAQGKFRGPEFPPLNFELEGVYHPRLKDSKGRSIQTVIARPVDAERQGAIETAGRQSEDTILRILDKKPGSTPTEVARQLGWIYGTKGEPNYKRAAKYLERLRTGAKLVEETRGCWSLTGKGQKELNDQDKSAAKTTADVMAKQPILPPITPRNEG